MNTRSGDQRLQEPILGDLIEKRSNTNIRTRSPKKYPHVFSKKSQTVSLLGYPCDQGVRRNQGLTGAMFGPACVRQALYSTGPLLNPDLGIDIRSLNIQDYGNIEVAQCLEVTHHTLTNTVKKILESGSIGVIIGGGGDLRYCNAEALMETTCGDIAVVNVSARLGVETLLKQSTHAHGENDKNQCNSVTSSVLTNGHHIIHKNNDGLITASCELAHSGSAFRQLLEDGQFYGAFYEFAVQGNESSWEHAKFVKAQGGDILWLNQIKNCAVQKFEKILCSFKERDTFVSFCVDSIQSSDCPGVNDPSCRGLTAQEALDVCFVAGKHPHTRLFDITGYNPKVEKDRTGKLVANLIYYFLMGVAARFDEPSE